MREEIQKALIHVFCSDDCRVIIWEFPPSVDEDIAEDAGMFFMEPVATIETGHSANIFGVKPMPQSGDRIIVTGAMDGEVRLHSIDRDVLPKYGGFHRSTFHGVKRSDFKSELLYKHRGRVKNVETSPSEPDLLWSSGEDGYIRQYDIRDCSSNNGKSLICLRSYRSIPSERRTEASQSGENESSTQEQDQERRIINPGAKFVRINQADPNYIAVACGDPFVRVYDRRMMPPGSLSGCTSFDEEKMCHHSMHDREKNCIRFAPLHMTPELVGDPEGVKTYKNHLANEHCTCVDFSPDGCNLAAYYHGDTIYMFDIRHPEGLSTKNWARTLDHSEEENMGCTELTDEEWWNSFPVEWIQLSRWLTKLNENLFCRTTNTSEAISRLVEDPPEIIQKTVQPLYSERVLKAKRKADDSFRKKDYLVAADLYSICLEIARAEGTNGETNHDGLSIIAANRSLCLLKTSRRSDAFEAALASRFSLQCVPSNWKAAARYVLAVIETGHVQRALNFAVRWIDWCKTNADLATRLEQSIDEDGPLLAAAKEHLAKARRILGESRTLANNGFERARKAIDSRNKPNNSEQNQGESSNEHNAGSSTSASATTMASQQTDSTTETMTSSADNSCASAPVHSTEATAKTMCTSTDTSGNVTGLEGSLRDSSTEEDGDRTHSPSTDDYFCRCAFGSYGVDTSNKVESAMYDAKNNLRTIPSQNWPGAKFIGSGVGVSGRYSGSCNVQTDIKEVAFWGEHQTNEILKAIHSFNKFHHDVEVDSGKNDENSSAFDFFNPGKDGVIVAGSDDGRIFFWDRQSGVLIGTIKADADGKQHINLCFYLTNLFLVLADDCSCQLCCSEPNIASSCFKWNRR